MTDDGLAVSDAAMYRDGYRRGGFESGIEMALRSILVSPNFCSVSRVSRPRLAATRRIASATSIWHRGCRSSCGAAFPMTSCLTWRRRGTCINAEVLAAAGDAECSRTRGRRRWSKNFAGQWLHIRNAATIRPSPELLVPLRRQPAPGDGRRKRRLFFESIIRENRSVLDLLDADYTFLNERLAKHYGIPGVYGERFRRVSLPADSAVGGLLGQGSILMDTSHAESDLAGHSRKVDPGEYFRRAAAAAAAQRAGAQGGPGPAEGAADARADGAAPRQSGLRRRATPRWTSWGSRSRTSTPSANGAKSMRPGAKVDASAQLPDGTKFNGPTELRQVLC